VHTVQHALQAKTQKEKTTFRQFWYFFPKKFGVFLKSSSFFVFFLRIRQKQQQKGAKNGH